MGNGKKKKYSRGSGYLHIYSSGFISLPADGAAGEHLMVGWISVLFSELVGVEISRGDMQVQPEANICFRLLTGF